MAIHPQIKTIRRAVKFVSGKAPGRRPKIAVVLGSGLSGAVPELRDKVVVPYEKIPGFPKPTVKGHSGRLILGRFGPKRREVAVLQGRYHFYEGHPMASVGLPIRLIRGLGVETVILTSAVGSMRPGLKPGHICVLKDHINFMGATPLRGHHTEEFGEMFLDMSGAYAEDLRRTALKECRRLGIPARDGVYTATMGPSYETPAEIRAYRAWGGDVVGMSVVPEVLIARQAAMRVLVLSWISNMAAGMSKRALSHAEVLELGGKAAARLRGLIEALFTKV